MEHHHRRNEAAGYSEKYISYIAYFVEEIENHVNVLYHFMERRKIKGFTLILMASENINIREMIQREKRDTDIIIKHNIEENRLAVLCQDTKVDGGYYFAKRVIEKVKKEYGEDVYCSEISVEKPYYPIVDLVIKSMEMFEKAKSLGDKTEIQYYTIK